MTPEAVDDTPAVITGNGWTITEAKIAELVSFIEETHDLEFLEDVAVLTSPDIGRDLGFTFAPFGQDEWSLLRRLGIVDDDRDRATVNQLRRDRIRGVCCGSHDDDQLSITVEEQPTRLETEMIVVHELVHALHAQHGLLDRFGPARDEYPAPASGATEGVPQLIALAWLETAEPSERERATDELDIITPDLAQVTGPGAKRILEFAYGAAPTAFAGAYADGGSALLNDLIENPPVTTEQALFPDKWRAQEEAIGVREPELSDVADSTASGTLGAALIIYALVEEFGEPAARDIASSWAGGTWVLYEATGPEAEAQSCLAARIAMDTAETAAELADALTEVLTDNSEEIETSIQSTRLEDVTVVRLDVC